MQAYLVNFFGDFGRIIVFLHIMSAAFLIGSMIMIRFIVQQALMKIDDEAVRYGRYIDILDRYFYYIFVIMIVLISASLTMSIGLGFQYANPTMFSLVHVKEALWLFIAFNFLYMYSRFFNAKRLYKKRNFFEVGENLGLIVNFVMPLNIMLAFMASYLGTVIRGF